jgi:hypothetical protein
MLVGYPGRYNISFLIKAAEARTRKKDMMIDLELPSSAKLSWWRLCGYGTRPNSVSNNEDEGASDDEVGDEGEDESEEESDEE